MSRVILLVATIPARQRSCERLLVEIALQTRQPDSLLLVLDGYQGLKWPAIPKRLPISVCCHKAAVPIGAGARWIDAPFGLAPDDVIINLDDDIMTIEAPRLIEALVATISLDPNIAAAAMGRGADGKQAPPGDYSRGPLIYGAGCGLAVRARHLAGLQELSAEVIAAGGPDALGPLGDDDALVSAHLWKQDVRIMHAATGNIYSAPNTSPSSQTQARLQRGEALEAQKRAIKAITGWPWPGQTDR